MHMYFPMYHNAGKASFNAKVLRNIEKIMADFSTCFNEGYRVMIQIYDNTSNGPFYDLDHFDRKGAGAFAPVKMNMLGQFPDIAGTGVDSPNELIPLVTYCTEHNKMSHEVANKLLNVISEAPSLDAITSETWDLLRGYGITRWYGGVRLAYTSKVSKEDQIEVKEGEIHVAVSGSKQWIDTMVSFWLLGCIQDLIRKDWEDDCVKFHTDIYKSNPQLQVWPTIFGLKAV